MGMTTVTAYDNANAARRLQCESSRTGENAIGLRRFKTGFYRKLQRVRRQEAWSAFACAEVNAAYLLTVFFNARLSDIRIEKAVDGHLLKDPCKNCSQWLEEIGNSRVFKIRAEFTFSDAEEGESRVPMNGRDSADPFPALPSRLLPAAAAASSPAKPGEDAPKKIPD